MAIGRINAVVLGAMQIVAVVGLWISATQAQITIDNTSKAAADTATLTFSHTVGSGLNSLLMVGVEVHANTKVKSVVWTAGSTVALTQVGAVTDSGNNVTVELWKLVNPPAGAGDIAITLPSQHRVVGGATSFFGVDQTAPLGTVAKNSADSGTPATVTVSATTGSLVLDAVGASPVTALVATGTGQTKQYEASSDTVTGAGSTAVSNESTVTMAWSLTVENWAIIAVPIHPAPTPTGQPLPPTPTPTPTATPTISVRCVGDCNGNGQVTISDIITIVNIALGNLTVSACVAADANNDGAITMDEILAAVNRALEGCSPALGPGRGVGSLPETRYGASRSSAQSGVAVVIGD